MGTKLHHTTSYHPQANGLIERFHRQLKDALRARLAGPHWFYHLPWILFGIRCAPKDDTNLSPAQLVYRTSLRVPGTLCVHPTALSTPAEHFWSLCDQFANLVPPQSKFHGGSATFAPGDLSLCPFVWVMVDRVRPPLEPPYKGPYRVLSQRDKTFLVDINGKADNVSIDRLKPTYFDASKPPPVVTSAGRVVAPPQQFRPV
ncbi:uncharacterized protein LOC131882508 [Tigriopus californicus]|uniref:uncharacterized protein LOC131882508 n=1 Tax=Tigriopus californicus TaxID=6832 RepID=UPI0027D9EE0B|nr:uncharacterized protein LOC131882508 [Tigriopus californicus]